MKSAKEKLVDLTSQQRRELLAKLLKKKARQPKLFPLSFSQERLWFVDQLDPGAVVYNMPTAMRFAGSLNLVALHQSLSEIVRRHDVLRTTFTTADNLPVQVVSPEFSLQFEVVSLRELPESDAVELSQDLGTQEAQRPFDLSRGPLLRVKLLELGDQDHVLLMTMHHIISDGWSMGILVKEVKRIYEGFERGKPSGLEDLKIQYSDYAHWQRDYLKGEILEQELGYWKEKLKGVGPVIELPTDRVRPPARTFQGSRELFLLSGTLTEGIRRLSHSASATLFITLLAVFKVLLHRYTGQQDIFVGIPIAGRDHLQIEDLIGFFVNALVIRSDVSDDLTFLEFLGQVRDSICEANAHQDIPFDFLVTELQPERSLSYSPLFQVMFTMQYYTKPNAEVPDLKMSTLRTSTETSKFDLSISMADLGYGIGGTLEYNSYLFDVTTMKRMVANMEVLFTSIVANPEERIADLQLITEAEQHQLLVEWNDTYLVYPLDQLVHHRMEAQVEETPDAIAVVFDRHQLSYRELDQRTNQLARYLKSLGVRPETPVGLYADRSLEMVIAILGIVKAGGAYVPLDSSYPVQRLAYMLEDSSVSILLTIGDLPPELAGGGAQILAVDTQWHLIAEMDTADPPCTVASDNPAYVIYTSGSTGKPKAAVNTHRGLLNRLLWMQAAYGLTASDRVLQKTPFSFDVSVWEFFWPVMFGAKLIVALPGGHRDATYLADLICEEEVTTIHFVPSMLQAFLEIADDYRCGSLRRVICSGEALPFNLQEQFHLRLRTELHNLYGPTEASIDVTYLHCRREEQNAMVPIGRPIYNTQIFILDALMRPVPVGVSGELYIAGDGLGRGYHERRDLTAEKFMPCPFGENGEQRMYRTGDVARFRPNGNIEFLGRADHQVKIRGFRIELGEIESALTGHRSVREAVVIVENYGGDSSHLTAYIVARDSQSPNVSELRGFLLERLPDYMVPSKFIVLDTIPLTTNGKVDRKALPASEDVLIQPGNTFIPTSTLTEELLANIWAEVLKVDRVGAADDFFDLGGHSLLATQVVSRLREVFRVEIPLRNVFEFRTISSFAERIDLTLRAEQNLPVPAIKSVDRATTLPSSFAQHRLWFLDQLEPGSAAYNMPSLVHLTGQLNLVSLQDSLNEIGRRHEVLRTAFATVDGQPVQVIAPAMRFELAVTDLSALNEEERSETIGLLGTQESGRPFNLRRGPLLRVSVLRISGENHIVLFTMHHIVSDGWSMGLLIREVASLYHSFSGGMASSLPELSIQYADFAVWQRNWFQGEVLRKHLEYWGEHLEGVPALNLPTDRQRPPVLSYRGATKWLMITEPLLHSLRSLSRKQNQTLFMTLLAAFKVLLSRYTGQDDIAIGAPIANRNRAEIENLIGFFVNTLVLRTKLSGNPTFRQVMNQVREMALDAYAYQDLPFEMLVDHLQPERDLNRNPIFQITFAVQNAPRGDLKLPGLELHEPGLENSATRFDLELHIWEQADSLGVLFIYSTDLFDEATIARMTEHFRVLLEDAVSHPEAPIRSLELMTEGARYQLLYEWNNPSVSFNPDACCHHLFEKQVLRSPDAVAVVADGQSFSYLQLNRLANQLAHRLISSGVRPDSLVAICLDRTADLVIAVLAVLKAGGGYLPLDPSLPEQRLAFMVEDGQVEIIITDGKLSAKLPVRDYEIILIEDDREILSWDNPETSVVADNLAYVIYTSGSTGKSKGVAITHYNLVRLFQATEGRFDFGPTDVWTMFHSYAFDFSVWEIWGALLNGGRLVVVDYWQSRSPEEFHKLLCEQSVSVLNQTPSAFRQLMRVDAISGNSLSSLKTIIFGGEALELRSLKPWVEKYGDENPELVNMYGITETTVHVTYRRIRRADIEEANGSRIGVGIDDLRVYVKDEQARIVPIGVRGELYVGGGGLARGYVGRAELTAERFVPDSEGEQPGARLYRTGDEGRYISVGEIEYTGRLDHQVKIRGLRIELGEIESELNGHPAVSESVVVTREDTPDDKRLVAYVVPKSDGQLPQEGISEWRDAHISQWQTLYDDTYSDSPTGIDPAFNIIGWNSSYTGQPIPQEEMQEWRDSTVDRILSLHPSSVLEIGCGTGLLMLKIASHCKKYWGTDFSQVSLQYVDRQLDQALRDQIDIKLLKRTAADFEGIEEQSFDMIILNSVVQYFPNADYLMRVLTRALRVLKPSGVIFLGDIRNLRLLEAFHASVQLYRASPLDDAKEIWQRVRRNASQEEELLIDPAFFNAFSQQHPEINRVEVLLKRGSYENELTRFRYDVVLQTGDEGRLAANHLKIDWKNHQLGLPQLQQLLREAKPDLMEVQGIPNGRIADAVNSIGLMASATRIPTISDLKVELARKRNGSIHPEDIWKLGEDNGYRVDLLISNSEDHCFSAIFQPPPAGIQGLGLCAVPVENLTPKPLNTYTNDPLRNMIIRHLGRELRSYLSSRMPEYMMPSSIVVIDALPLTTNGKVDRRALPAPDRTATDSESEFIPPASLTEQLVAGIWSDVLGVNRISLQDNFFDLGGHSLLATQVMSRLRDAFRIEMPLRRLFESPTLAALSAAVEEQSSVGHRLQTPALVSVSREDLIPLSYAQQRLWFLDQLESFSTAYNISSGIRVDGELSLLVLEQTLTEIVRRHEALRTCFEDLEGRPSQIIEGNPHLAFAIGELTDLNETERELEIERIAKEEARRPFDLSRGPLLRVSLLRTQRHQHVLLLTMHHIVSDGWSMGVLVKEVLSLYESYQQGQPSRLEELKIQYADYAVWQRRYLSGDVLDQELRYWKEKLAGISPVINLPTDRPRPAVQSYRGGAESLVLDGKLSESLKSFSRSESATMYMVLLAGFEILLQRMSRSREIVIGTPIAGRRETELEGLIGFFVNTLVIRGEIEPRDSYREVLRKVREELLAAYSHQDIPFEQIVEQVDPERSLSHSPLFQVMFVMQNAPSSEEVKIPGLKLSGLDQHSGTTKFDLLLNLREDGSNIIGILEYSADLFDKTTIKRMLEHFTNLLRNVVVTPDEPVSTVSLMSEPERHQLLTEWNATSGTCNDTCVHRLVEAQVDDNSDAIAVVFEDQQISFSELNRRANQLAHYINRLGIGADDTIGICMERSVEMAVGVLGTLKAGAAYVPLDFTYPKQRLSQMLESTRMLITQQRLLASLAVQDNCVICIDSDWSEIGRESDLNPQNEVHPDNLVYVIHTSGSTGKPKGVAMTHRAAANLTNWQMERSPSSAGKRTLQFASTGFDVSFQELFSTWCCGGTLVLISDDARRDDLQLWQALITDRIERIFVPFVIVQQLAERAEKETVMPYNLKEIITAGEQLKVTPQIQRFFGALRQCSLDNQYGPSESHVVTACTLSSEADEWSSLPPIGRPISNTGIYILDENLDSASIGIPGELCIAGSGLARGYINQPDLTAEKFVPNQDTDSPGARLYKTGDLSRVLPDGTIEFIGRIDHQVKMRGYRIELSEIETVLSQHTSVRDCIVILREDIPGDKRLVAYVVTEDTLALTTSDLKAMLREQLPEYMMPSSIVVIDALPLTTNGKVDRRALPAPDRSATDSESDFIPPSSLTEQLVAGIWSDVLGVNRISLQDNFFDLGGHSLLATQAMSRLRDAFRVELPLRRLFESPTLAALSAAVDEQSKRGHLLLAPALGSVSRDDLIPLSFAQQRLWFLDQLESFSTAYNISSGIRIDGELSLVVLEQTLTEIVRRHEALRTCFKDLEGRPSQIIDDNPHLAFAIGDLAHLDVLRQEGEIERIVKEEARRPFDLSRGPLLRVSLLRTSSLQHVLVLTMHHIVSDGWSMGVLVKEVLSLYGSFHQGEASGLEELKIQYADYAVWQREFLSGEMLDQELRYWKEKLEGIPPVINLPTDRPRPPVQSYRGGAESLVLDGKLSESLKSFSRSESATLYMVLLAGFEILLHRMSRSREIVIGTPIAGRRETDLEGLIGFFVNNLVIRGEIEPRDSYREVLRKVREESLAAYSHQDIPFEQIVEQVDPERSLSHSPLFQVVFGFANAPTEELKIPHLSFSPIDMESGVSKFDLTLTMSESQGTLWASAEYNADLFDALTIKRILRQYQCLIEAAISYPAQLVSMLPLLAEQERHQLLIEWSGEHLEYPSDSSISELFEEQSDHSPDALALVFEDEHVSYQELDRRGNRLARHLRALGVKNELRVGLCVNRSVEMIVGMLGILKAGGVYVPIDSEYPIERIEFLLGDAQIPILLTQNRLAAELPATMLQVICLDTDWDLIANESSERSGNATIGLNLAYIMYTSGSTGRPKGVAVTQQAIARLVREANYVKLDCEEVLLQMAPISFDASTFEIWGSLLNGGRLVIMDRDAPSLEKIEEVIQQNRVTTLWLTAALFQQMVENNIDGLRGIKQLLAGGDVLPVAQVERVINELPRVTLINGYGPTENTTFTCCYKIGSGGEVGAQVPIGRPIANTQALILDANLQPVPIGAVGELCITGDGLARSYFDRPEQTAESFQPNPYSTIPGERLYLSGDEVKQRPDGVIEFLGRRDGQIKIRGYRIDVGEIEYWLNQRPGVEEAVVVARTGSSGDKRLVAYVAAQANPDTLAMQLRNELKQRLPEYMIPSAFVTLDQMPHSPNGKINRLALTAPEENRDSRNAYRAPRTPTEEILVGIWSTVLGIKQIGVDEDFFELGGHSLLATQVISRVREAFCAEISLQTIFASSTISEFASAIEAQLKVEQKFLPPSIRPASREGKLPLSFAQQRLWFLDQLEPNSVAYNIPAAVRLKGKLGIAALDQSLAEIDRRHEVLRTTFTTILGEPIQVISPHRSLTLPIVDLTAIPREKQESAVAMLAAIDAQTPFNLSTGPLSRATMLRVNDDEHVVLFTMHHIVSDGWSRDVLIHEVASLYQAFRDGTQSSLEEIEIHYADFAAWQREYLSGEVLEEQLGYWKEQLVNAPEILDLPTDKPRSNARNYSGATYTFALSSDLTRGLRALSNREGATLFMVLLAGFKVLLYRYTGSPDVVVGTGIANRNKSEIERLIGFFVNMLVLRTDLSGNPTFSELLKRVREVALGAYAHQDLPFEMLVEKHLSNRNLSHSPLFQVTLFLQNASTKSLELPGIALSYLNSETGGTHFDMTIGITESADELLVAAEYDTSLFEESTIKLMMEQFARILECMVKDPGARILHVPLEKAKAACVTEQGTNLLTNDQAEQFDFTM